MSNSTLWVTGDSFAEVPFDDINERIWSIQLSKKLKCNLANNSLAGSSQDWAFRVIGQMAHDIKPNDHLIVVLTDPGRFWFFEDNPALSNSRIIEFDTIAGPGKTEAAEGYFKYVQRPELDIQMLGQRLGWLNNLARVKHWKKPIVILAFNQIILDIQNYDYLNFALGTLAEISEKEEIRGTIEPKGVDPRYNHLCLSNHDILSDRLAAAILNNTQIDMTYGFLEGMYTTNLITDPSKAAAELSTLKTELFNSLPSLNDTEKKTFLQRIFS